MNNSSERQKSQQQQQQKPRRARGWGGKSQRAREAAERNESPSSSDAAAAAASSQMETLSLSPRNPARIAWQSAAVPASARSSHRTPLTWNSTKGIRSPLPPMEDKGEEEEEDGWGQPNLDCMQAEYVDRELRELSSPIPYDEELRQVGSSASHPPSRWTGRVAQCCSFLVPLPSEHQPPPPSSFPSSSSQSQPPQRRVVRMGQATPMATGFLTQLKKRPADRIVVPQGGCEEEEMFETVGYENHSPRFPPMGEYAYGEEDEEEEEEAWDDGNCSKDSGLAETDDSSTTRCRAAVNFVRLIGGRQRRTMHEKEEEERREDERTAEAKLRVYSNDLLMETIISHVTQLSDRSRVELASTRMHALSKAAPYRFSHGGDHLHIHFTTFDDFATIQYGSVVRTVPILTMDTRRFDAMQPRMTTALRRILDHIGARFARKVRRLTLGGTTPFYAARGVPNHHLIITYDLLEYVLSSFPSISELRLINCGFDDGAIDMCDDARWQAAVGRLEVLELRTCWADSPARMPSVLQSISSNLERLTLTRFTCKRMGHALLEQLHKKRCRLKELELVIDEDTAENAEEASCLLKDAASRTESLRVTVAEVGDGTTAAPRCFALLARMREVPNLTELKVCVMPKTADQFGALVSLFSDLSSLSRLRTLHVEGWVDAQWTTPEMIGRLTGAFRSGMEAVRQTLEDVSFANFPKPTKHNVHGFREPKESAYKLLLDAMARSIGSWKTRRLALASMRMDDATLRSIYDSIGNVVEEVYLKNIRRVSQRSVAPLINGEFPRLRRMEAEIAIDPLVLANLAEVRKTPHLQYAKFALKHRISAEDHHWKLLRTMFSGVFLDQESPRGSLHQFVEVHHRIAGAVAPAKSQLQPATMQQQQEYRNRTVRPFDYKTAGYGRQPPVRRAKPKKLYGEWD